MFSLYVPKMLAFHPRDSRQSSHPVVALPVEQPPFRRFEALQKKCGREVVELDQMLFILHWNDIVQEVDIV